MGVLLPDLDCPPVNGLWPGLPRSLPPYPPIPANFDLPGWGGGRREIAWQSRSLSRRKGRLSRSQNKTPTRRYPLREGVGGFGFGKLLNGRVRLGACLTQLADLPDVQAVCRICKAGWRMCKQSYNRCEPRRYLVDPRPLAEFGQIVKRRAVTAQTH